jgi:uracil-DNA glycosylase
MAKTRVRGAPEASDDLAFVGEGDPQAKLVFVTKEAFVDKSASDLLHKMIEAMGLKKADVLIAHITEPHSPGALKFESINAQIVVSLGEKISQSLLESGSSISDLRGVFRSFRGRKLIATFHPEDLLKNPELKKSVWTDLQNVAKELGISVPSRK